MTHLAFWDENYDYYVEDRQGVIRMESRRPTRRSQQQQELDDGGMGEECMWMRI